eukprot:1007152-Rhodomonas_salina.2
MSTHNGEPSHPARSSTHARTPLCNQSVRWTLGLECDSAFGSAIRKCASAFGAGTNRGVVLDLAHYSQRLLIEH